VSFSLEPHEDGTNIQLKLEGLPPGRTEETIAGWSEALQALREYVEAGLDARTVGRCWNQLHLAISEVAKAKGLRVTEGMLVMSCPQEALLLQPGWWLGM
jgi:hypothetical protein